MYRMYLVTLRCNILSFVFFLGMVERDESFPASTRNLHDEDSPGNGCFENNRENARYKWN